MECYGEDSPAKASQDPYCQGGEKVFVISLSNTIINPGAMMIKALHVCVCVCVCMCMCVCVCVVCACVLCVCVYVYMYMYMYT